MSLFKDSVKAYYYFGDSMAIIFWSIMNIKNDFLKFKKYFDVL